MDLYSLYKLVNIVARKDRNGALGYGDFNVLLQTETRNHFDFLIRYYERDPKARESLRPFMVEETGLTPPIYLLTGSGSLSTSALSDLSFYPYKMKLRANGGRPIILVDDNESWYYYVNASIKGPTVDNPIARIRDEMIEVKPDSVSVDVSYVKHPPTPYMDGYIDANDNFNFLKENVSTTLSADQEALDGSSDTSYESKTVPLDFNEEDQLEIASRILGDLGIAYNKASLVQYANQIKAEG